MGGAGTGGGKGAARGGGGPAKTAHHPHWPCRRGCGYLAERSPPSGRHGGRDGSRSPCSQAWARGTRAAPAASADSCHGRAGGTATRSSVSASSFRGRRVGEVVTIIS